MGKAREKIRIMTLLYFAEKVEVPELLTNPWFLAVFGWILYNVGKLLFDQKKYDLDNDGLGTSEVSKFFKHEWIGMLFSFMLLILATPYTSDIWVWFMDLIDKDYPFTNMAYGFVGVWMVGLQYFVSLIRKKTNAK